MVSSTAIPNAIVKIIDVLVFNSTPKNPITPAIKTSGIKFVTILISKIDPER